MTAVLNEQLIQEGVQAKKRGNLTWLKFRIKLERMCQGGEIDPDTHRDLLGAVTAGASLEQRPTPSDDWLR